MIWVKDPRLNLDLNEFLGCARSVFSRTLSVRIFTVTQMLAEAAAVAAFKGPGELLWSVDLSLTYALP